MYIFDFYHSYLKTLELPSSIVCFKKLFKTKTNIFGLFLFTKRLKIERLTLSVLSYSTNQQKKHLCLAVKKIKVINKWNNPHYPSYRQGWNYQACNRSQWQFIIDSPMSNWFFIFQPASNTSCPLSYRTNPLGGYLSGVDSQKHRG